MATEPRIAGEYGELQEQPGSPAYEFGTTTKCTRTFEGPFVACLEQRPFYGQSMEDTGTLQVVNVSVVRTEAGHGEMTIVLESPDYQRDGFGSTDGEEAQQETYEVDWVEIDRPLLTNPHYSSLTAAEQNAFEAWKNETNPKTREQLAYTDVDTEQSVALSSYPHGSLLENAAQKVLKGIDSYREWQPVARINSLHVAIPSTQPCGVWTNTKPFEACPSGYKWMKTADRPLRNGTSGRWTRNIEWTGFEDIDGDLYDSI
jgi:hypothetical protein